MQVVHGMTEYALRYDYFAEKLCENGYTVYAHDHRGHGETSKEDEERGYIADNEGFDILVEDVKELTDIIKEENPNYPVVGYWPNLNKYTEIEEVFFDKQLAEETAAEKNKFKGIWNKHTEYSVLEKEILDEKEKLLTDDIVNDVSKEGVTNE